MAKTIDTDVEGVEKLNTGQIRKALQLARKAQSGVGKRKTRRTRLKDIKNMGALYDIAPDAVDRLLNEYEKFVVLVRAMRADDVPAAVGAYDSLDEQTRQAIEG